jgi:SAM-dependent methyltransferase
MLARWEMAATGWRKRADEVREIGMPVSEWMIDSLALQPGHRVLELAAGPGDTGLLAAELIQPGGTLISSDATDAMLAIARDRARRMGVANVEFKRLQLEWIDLPTACVDAVLCRWALMLTLDPSAAVKEIRRVLRPGGKAAVAVWDEADRNPWATVPNRAMIELGHLTPPDPDAPGMFTLAAPGRLAAELEAGGFVDVRVEAVALPHRYQDLDRYLAETLDLSRMFSDAFATLDGGRQAEVKHKLAELAADYTASDGSLELPGSSLVALANA